MTLETSSSLAGDRQILFSMRGISAGVLLFACLLAPLTGLKVGDIEPVEFFLMIWLLVTVYWLEQSHGVFSLSPDLVRLGKHYCLFALLTLIGSVLSLRLTLYVPADAVGDVFKLPEFISIARLVQLAVIGGSVIVFANLLSRDASLLRFVTASYMWVGIANGLFAIVSWCALSLANLDLLGAYLSAADHGVPRARAFFNEGGPYGLYAVSVIFVVLFRKYALRDVSRGMTTVALAVEGSSLVLSMSKAGIFCLGAIWLWCSIRRLHWRHFILASGFILLVLVASPVRQQLEGYWQSYRSLEAVAALEPDNGNIVVGRIAALYIAPRIVASHPLAGVGLGNYSLVRNNPDYLGLIPQSDYWDLPGLGLLGYAPELGIPLLLYLLWIIWYPVRPASRGGVTGMVIAVSAFQCFAELFGAQVTFFYPWLVTAIALGFTIGSDERRRKLSASPTTAWW